VGESLAIGCRLRPEDLHQGVDNKPDGSAILLHLAQAKEGLHHGSIADKVDFARNHFEKEVSVGAVFVTDSRVSPADGIPRSCLGRIVRIQFTVPRAGQKGYNHRTEINKKIYIMGAGDAMKDGKNNAATEYDLAPMGGFLHYGEVKQEFILLKGCCIGPKKRLLTPSGSLSSHTPRRGLLRSFNLEFIDTSSKFGHGRFQTL